MCKSAEVNMKNKTLEVWPVPLDVFANFILHNLFIYKDIRTKKWRRGDSNPRPEMFQDKRLHA